MTILDLIGNTPLLCLDLDGLKEGVKLFAKAEFMNVGGSVKDRAAKAMLLGGIESGRLAAFERECTKRGVPPVTANIAGGNFILWRGIPIIPTDKLLVDGLKNPKSKSGKTNILLIRTGEAKRGVIGLYQASPTSLR